jgi:hypothetical protein
MSRILDGLVTAACAGLLLACGSDGAPGPNAPASLASNNTESQNPYPPGAETPTFRSAAEWKKEPSSR